MGGRRIDPDELAAPLRAGLQARVRASPRPIRLRGILAAGAPRPSLTYAERTAAACLRAGVAFELIERPAARVAAAVADANADDGVDGVVVYYPVHGGRADRALQNLVRACKDAEGLSTPWTTLPASSLDDVLVSREGAPPTAAAVPASADVVYDARPVLPCTPLAVLYALRALGLHDGRGRADGRTVAVFNRSVVVGRPLAALLARDGARVYSFDVEDVLLHEGRSVREVAVERARALAEADAVVTAVPTTRFEPIRGRELREGAIAINVASVRNVDDDVLERARAFLPRIGPLTVAALLLNTLRLVEATARERAGAAAGAVSSRSP